jgi:hypothetical protein
MIASEIVVQRKQSNVECHPLMVAIVSMTRRVVRVWNGKRQGDRLFEKTGGVAWLQPSDLPPIFVACSLRHFVPRAGTINEFTG